MTYVYMAQRMTEEEFLRLTSLWEAPEDGPAARPAPANVMSAQAEAQSFMAFMGAQNALARETAGR